MQKFRYLIVLSLLITAFGSCKKDTLPTYESKSSIYFSAANVSVLYTAVDTLAASFGYELPTVTELNLKIAVSVTGAPSDHDRQFTVTTDNGYSAVAGTDFKALDKSYTFGAGKTTDTLVVTVYRTEHIKTDPVDFVLHLQPNDNFNTDLQSRSDEFWNGPEAPEISYVTVKVTLDDILVQPKNWLVNYGKFDAKKFYLLCDLSGLRPVYFNSDPPTYVYQTGLNAGILLTRYLAEQKAAGTPVLYEDGSEMRTDD